MRGKRRKERRGRRGGEGREEETEFTTKNPNGACWAAYLPPDCCSSCCGGILIGLCLYKAAFDHALRLHVDVDSAGNRHLVTLDSLFVCLPRWSCTATYNGELCFGSAVPGVGIQTMTARLEIEGVYTHIR